MSEAATWYMRRHKDSDKKEIRQDVVDKESYRNRRKVQVVEIVPLVLPLLWNVESIFRTLHIRLKVGDISNLSDLSWVLDLMPANCQQVMNHGSVLFFPYGWFFTVFFTT